MATTVSPTTATTVPSEEERAAIIAGCIRVLSGHPPRSIKETLLALSEATNLDDDWDLYGVGKTVAAFESEIATLLGKEAAVFLPTGTMTQQIALRIWADHTSRHTVAFHPMCHVETREEKAYQLLHGLHAHLVGDPKRLMTLADLESTADPLAAVLWELPQRDLGGQLPQWDDLLAQTAWAHEHGAMAHMDGARLWESAPFYGRSYAEIAAPFDSVYVSFYKGLGAMSGSALAGSADFIAAARVWQKRHGGTLFHIAPYVLSARQSLHARLDRFPAYHERAVQIAAVLAAILGIRVQPDPPQTHMMHVYLEGDPDRLTATGYALMRETRVNIFRALYPTDVPGISMFELSIGDGAFAVTDDEIRDLFTRVMSNSFLT